MRLSLRPATDTDTPVLHELYAGTRRDEFAAWGWSAEQQAMFVQMQFRAQQQHYRAQFPHAEHLIICADDQPIGRMIVERGTVALRLIDLVIAPQQRNRGIGTTLLRQLLAEGAQRSVPVRLQVVHTNPALRLYRRLGFAIIADDGLYYQMEAPAPPATN